MSPDGFGIDSGIDGGPEAPGPAPARERLPWSAADDAFVEPPMPWSLRVDLDETDVDTLSGLSTGRRAGIPWYMALLAYGGLRSAYDDLPDFTLYALFGLVFVLNRFLAALQARKHYLRPGTITMTVSADGVEVSAETFAGHHPWVEVDDFDRNDEYLWVRTRTQPGLHALPLRGADPAARADLDAWIAYRRARAPSQLGRRLTVAFMLLAALGAGLYLAWDWVRPWLPL